MAETGIMEMPGALVQDQRGQWHEEDALEPSRAVTTRFYPTEDGLLTQDPVRGGAASFVDNGLGVDPRGACFYVGVGWILGCAPVEGRIGGVVDIPNACVSVAIPTDMFEFDIHPNASGPTKQVDSSKVDLARAR